MASNMTKRDELAGARDVVGLVVLLSYSTRRRLEIIVDDDYDSTVSNGFFTFR
jgi:hypothetical protein